MEWIWGYDCVLLLHDTTIALSMSIKDEKSWADAV